MAPLVVPYIIPHITPPKEFRLQLIGSPIISASVLSSLELKISILKPELERQMSRDEFHPYIYIYIHIYIYRFRV